MPSNLPGSVAVATAPLTINLQGGTTDEVLAILNAALNILGMIPATAPEALLGQLLLGIITSAVGRIKSESGKPIDLSLIQPIQPLS